MTTSLTAIEAFTQLYRLAEDEDLRKRIVNFFKHKDKIVVLGSTGTGKTNLLNSLEVAAALVEAVPAMTRTEATEERGVIVDERPFKIIDTPGQAGHVSQRQKLYRELANERPIRVINVVSFGYHEYASGHGEALDDEGQVRGAWLERHRDNELTAMSEWLPLLGNREVTKWVLTVVSKADLWWNEHEAVLEYYRSGEYAELLKRSDPLLEHHVLPYSSVFHRFYGEAVLAGSFDDDDRLKTTRHFLQQLAALG